MNYPLANKGRDLFRIMGHVLVVTDSPSVEYLNSSQNLGIPLFCSPGTPQPGYGFSFLAEFPDGYLTFEKGSYVKTLDLGGFTRAAFDPTTVASVKLVYGYTVQDFKNLGSTADGAGNSYYRFGFNVFPIGNPYQAKALTFTSTPTNDPLVLADTDGYCRRAFERLQGLYPQGTLLTPDNYPPGLSLTRTEDGSF